MPAASTASPAHEWADSFKGIIMAFMMALVFRAFVIEGFEIPTGSMAPTLRGQHTQWDSPNSGKTWAVGPWYYGQGQNPLPIQGSGFRAYVPSQAAPVERTPPLVVTDPMSGIQLTSNATPIRGGDRVFILKYLWPLYTPSRYDVIVFKNPRDPSQNYIKRLVGVGPEQIAIIDGDVFSRPITAGETPPQGQNTWALPGWSIQRKPDSAQRTMWQPVFDSQYTPINAVRDGRQLFRSPWVAAGDSATSWQMDGRADYRFDGTAPATLAWDSARRSIVDYYAYNEGTGVRNGVFPVSDLRVSFGIRPDKDGLSWSGTIQARGHDFRADIDGTKATLRMKDDDGEWSVLATGDMPKPLTADHVTNIDFWHADQALSLFVEDRLIARGEYNWSPADRIQNSLGISLEEVFTSQGNMLLDENRYKKPHVSMEFRGGPFTLYRVALDRDIHYQAANYAEFNDASLAMPQARHSRALQPAAATHPRTPHYLQEGEFFFCGDNSPSSLDNRLMDYPNPWMARNEPHTGMVGRDSLIGRAFVVYWPGILWRGGRLPVFDTGRIRQIR